MMPGFSSAILSGALLGGCVGYGIGSTMIVELGEYSSFIIYRSIARGALVGAIGGALSTQIAKEI